MSSRGRLVLINAFLNAILIYTLSFYKDLVKVWKGITKIQSNFLWNGSEQRKSIHWVSWKKMCTANEKGELEIKNIELFNISLLLKWKFRIIHEKEAIWCDLLKHHYVNVSLVLMNEVGRT